MEKNPLAPPADNFFSRWSRRKDAVRLGEPVADPQPAGPMAPREIQQSAPVDPAVLAPHHAAGEAKPEPAKPLSLADAQVLRADSDFVPFMARGVTPEVRNAAMKKLFADPHYNVMDGLDIYIDDYSKSVPLPLEVIKRLASAKFLGLFEEEAKPAVAEDAERLSSDDEETLPVLPSEAQAVVADSQPLQDAPKALQQQEQPLPSDRANT